MRLSKEIGITQKSAWFLLHASPKHLARYVNEFTFRLNDGNVKRHTLARLDGFVRATAGRRLTYKALTQ